MFCFVLRFYLFLARGEGKEKENKRNIVWLLLACPLMGTWPKTQECALTGNQTDDPLLHSLALNPLSQASQGKVTCFTTTSKCNGNSRALTITFSATSPFQSLVYYEYTKSSNLISCVGPLVLVI